MDMSDQPGCSHYPTTANRPNESGILAIQTVSESESDKEDLSNLRNFGTLGRLSGGKRRSVYQDVTTARLRQSMLKGKSNKHCEYVVASEQTLVYAICLAVAKYRAFNPNRGKESQNYWRRVRRHCEKSPSMELERLAVQLRIEAELPPANVFVGMEFLDRIERTPMLDGISIRVFMEGTKKQIWGQDNPPINDHMIHLCLYHHGGYIFFAVIWGIVTFLSARGYCETCKEVLFNLKRHICPYRCNYCGLVKTGSSTGHTSLIADCPKIAGQEKSCSNCLRKFFSTDCFEQHLHVQGTGRWGIPKCYSQRLCFRCGRYYSLKKHEDSFVNTHKCSERRLYICNFCKQQVPIDIPHLNCFLPILKPKKVQRSRSIVFLDLETRICEETNRHVPNLLTTLTSCSKCWSKDMYDACTNRKCGKSRVSVWQGENCVQEFVEQFFSFKNADATIISHFGSRFDFQFLLSALASQCKIPEKTFTRGNRILYAKFKCGIRMICWANYIPTSLANLCKSFKVPIPKSFFCYDMNELNVQHVYCHLRPAWEFPVDGRNTEAFKKYHDEHYDKVFPVAQEMSVYCQRDSYALSFAAMRFREELIKLVGIDLFAETGTFTISGLTLRVFQTRYLQENTLSIYRGESLVDRNSRFAMAFLTAYGRYFGTHVQHAGNGREMVINCNSRSFKVDGVEFEPNSDRIAALIDIHGCYWHSCPTCTSHIPAMKPLTLLGGKTPLQVRELDYLRANKIAKSVSPIHYDIYWEHECRNILSTNRLMKQFFTAALTDKPLNVYDANFGGRIDTFQVGMYSNMHISKPNADFLDFCSLYPAMCLMRPMAQGAGKIWSEGAIYGDLNEWILNHFGVAKAWVHYSRGDIYIPPLPFRASLPNGDMKIFYSTCAACCIEQNMHTCTHSFDEQIFRGTWTTVELSAAIKHAGLKVIRILSAHIYEPRVWTKERGPHSGLISAFMLEFYKLKCQASDIPPDKTAEEYSNEIDERFGIRIPPTSFQPNPVRRSVAKLMLNSLIGKFAQKKGNMNTDFYNDRASLLQMLENPNVNVHWIQHFGSADASKLGDESVVMLQHSVEQDSSLGHVGPNNAFSLPIITALVTGYARVELYEAMLRMPEESLLYTDTDSIMTLDGSNMQELCGHYLGQLTPVLKDQYHLDHVCIVGPKQYAYTARHCITGEIYRTVRLRGFASSAEVDEQGYGNRKPAVTYENMCDAVTSLLEKTPLKKLGVNELNFILTKDFNVTLDGRQKLYKPVSNKRFFIPPGVGGAKVVRTYPFGYNRL